MKNFFLTLLTFISLSAAGQSQGIAFSEGRSWQQVLDSARKTGSLIFVDVYTDWCGPCKTMDQEVFSQALAGQAYNGRFINVKVDAEKGEGPELKKRYAVRGYPSFLFVNGEGTLIYRTLGSMPLQDLVRASENALAESRKPETIVQLEANHLANKSDKALALAYLRRLTDLRLPVAGRLEAYVSMLKPAERAAPEVIRLIADNGAWRNEQLSLGPAFSVLEANKKVLDSLLRAGALRSDQSFESLRNVALAGSLHRAIKERDEALFRRIRAMKKSSDEDPFDNLVTLEMAYYSGVKNAGKYKTSATFYVEQVLFKLSADTLSARNARIVGEVRKSLVGKNDPKLNVDEELKSYKYAYTAQVVRALSSACESMLKLPLDQREMRMVKDWSLRAVKITETDPNYYRDGVPVCRRIYAIALYRSGERAEGLRIMREVVAPLPQTTKVKQIFGAVLEQMELGQELKI